jgi:hypothetical protein
VESLADSRLEIRLYRPRGSFEETGDGGDEARRVEVVAVGDRWAGVRLPVEEA